jgi:hypothetical protein
VAGTDIVVDLREGGTARHQCLSVPADSSGSLLSPIFQQTQKRSRPFSPLRVPPQASPWFGLALVVIAPMSFSRRGIVGAACVDHKAIAVALEDDLWLSWMEAQVSHI